MNARLTEIWRHPIKSIGRERLEQITLEAGNWLRGDRLWAVTHDRSEIDEGAWAPCRNFLRTTHGPALMAVTATFDEGDGALTLDHPEAGQLVLTPDDPGEIPRLLDWLSRIWPADLPAPTGIYSYGGGSLTDSSQPHISIFNHASHRAVEERVGKALSIHRWRGNVWIDGLGPWQEFEWIGKEISIGDTVLAVEERIGRCRATMANPETGRRDADPLAALDTWGHRDFGVYARVIRSGEIHVGDPVVVPQ